MSRIISPRERSWIRGLVNRLASNSTATGDEALRSASQTLKWLRQAVRANEPPPWKRRRLAHERRCLARLVHRHAETGEPLSYILGEFCHCISSKGLIVHTGTHRFGPLELEMKTPVLIPRVEVGTLTRTELMRLKNIKTEEWALKLAKMINESTTVRNRSDRVVRILELGTGSGCISLALASLLPAGRAALFASDVSPFALALARRNRAKNRDAQRNQVFFVRQDMESKSESSPAEGFDMIISNPPYLTESEYAAAEPSVRDWEWKGALVGGQDGLQFYRAIAKLLAPPSDLPMETDLPYVVLEIGASQAEQVREIFRATGLFCRMDIWKDMFGRDRVFVGYRQ